MILGEQGNALSVDMWHCPFKLESDPIIVHRLVDVHQSVENVKAKSEEVSIAFKALTSSAVSHGGTRAPC